MRLVRRFGSVLLLGGVFLVWLPLGGCRCEEVTDQPKAQSAENAQAKDSRVHTSTNFSPEQTALPKPVGIAAPNTDAIPPPSKVVWRSEVKGETLATPVIHGDRVYFTTMDGDAAGVNLSDGSKVWSFTSNGPFSAPPVVSNDHLLAASHDGNLYALRPDTGNVEWTVPSRFGRSAAPAIQGETIYAAGADGRLVALESSSGHELWSTNASRGLTAPVVDEGGVFVGSADHHVHAYDGETGIYRWHMSMRGPVAATPEVHGDLLIVASRGGDVRALDTATGEAIWINDLDHGVHAFAGDDHVIVAAAADGFVFALDPVDGQVLWSVPVETAAAPAILGNNVLVSDLNGDLVLIRGGEIQWRFGLDAKPTTTPLLAGETILVGTLDSGVIAVQ